MKPARIFLFTILYVSLTFLYTSCVREDTGDCIQYVLDMQAVDSEGNDLTATDALQKVEVYLFNEKGFIRKIPTDISSDLIFRDDKNERLTLVVWGNIKKDTLIAPDIPIGTTIEEARFRLREDTEGRYPFSHAEELRRRPVRGSACAGDTGSAGKIPDVVNALFYSIFRG